MLDTLPGIVEERLRPGIDRTAVEGYDVVPCLRENARDIQPNESPCSRHQNVHRIAFTSRFGYSALNDRMSSR
jgi:hypothetical protein